MIKNRLFWYVLMTGSIVGWIFLVYGCVRPLKPSALRTLWIYVLFIWGAGHPCELFITVPVGRKAGVQLSKTVLYTLLFGFTWWVPLKKGVFNNS